MRSSSSVVPQPTSPTVRPPPGRSLKRKGLRNPPAQTLLQTWSRLASEGQNGCPGSPRPSRSTCMIFPAMLRSSYVRKARGSTNLKLAASPLPTHSVPSGAERTVPMECEVSSLGMQSTLLDGAGHAPEVWDPSKTLLEATTLVGLTV